MNMFRHFYEGFDSFDNEGTQQRRPKKYEIYYLLPLMYFVLTVTKE